MKKLLLIISLLVNVACDKGASLELYGVAKTSFQINEAPAFSGAEVIENSYVYQGNDLKVVYDYGAVGEMSVATIGASLLGFHSPKQVLKSNARFSYVIEHNGVYKNFVTRSSKVHLLTSTDLINWTEEGIILNNVEGSYRHQQWNASVAYDSRGKGFMLVESGSGTLGQGDVRLTHLEAAANTNNFLEVSTPPILGGGNAWVTSIEGRGLLAIYGSIGGESGNHWRIRMSILPIGASEWVEAPLSLFDISAKDIHVADPHLIETKDGRILMSFSFDQAVTMTLISKDKLSFAKLYDRNFKKM